MTLRLRMLEAGAHPLQIDSALEEFGFALGPFTVADLSGLDIAWRMRQNAAPHRGLWNQLRRHRRMLWQVRFGQKTQHGWYRYSAGSTQPLPAPHCPRPGRRRVPPERYRAALLTQWVRSSGARSSQWPMKPLCCSPTVSPRVPPDIDLMMTLEYGFPATAVAGLLGRARRSPRSSPKEQLRQLSGERYRTGDLELLTEDLLTPIGQRRFAGGVGDQDVPGSQRK
ncbi:MAG: hypothetical protein EOO27_45540 [Comamonadaceae bacterium]|nr:MAG: hypothetical protein EOO27_45540 [Comamonadaceae bacterium]